MKKITNIFLLVLLSIAFVSCSKKDAKKDLNLSLAKLEQFNKTFDEFYEDGVISTDTIKGEEKSEFDELKKCAMEYYEAINKINSTIKEEKEDGESEYAEEYYKALEENNEEILNKTSRFEENISKIPKP